jgi:hypothetical protein
MAIHIACHSTSSPPTKGLGTSIYLLGYLSDTVTSPSQLPTCTHLARLAIAGLICTHRLALPQTAFSTSSRPITHAGNSQKGARCYLGSQWYDSSRIVVTRIYSWHWNKNKFLSPSPSDYALYALTATLLFLSCLPCRNTFGIRIYLTISCAGTRCPVHLASATGAAI